MLVGAALVQSLGEGGPAETVPPASAEGTGLLKVVAYPWAEVYVNGVRREMTPRGHALRLPAGEHRLRLSHPDLPEYVTTVHIDAESLQRLQVDLTGAGRFDASDGS